MILLNFSPESLKGSTARFVMVVDDPSDCGGRKEIWPVREEHGWYIGRVVDLFGHHWEIGRSLPR